MGTSVIRPADRTVATCTGARTFRQAPPGYAARVDEGRLQVDVGAVLPLAEAADARRMQEAGEVAGKVVLTA